jgi:glucose/arabinose dehydrogenase
MAAGEKRGSSSQFFSVVAIVAAVALAAIPLALLPPRAADAAATLPSGFQESVVLSGLTYPTVVQFSKDGRVFVAEKSGLIKVFDGLSDTTPTTFADLRTNVHTYGDRGLLGMALDPNFPTNPYVYVLYTYDAEIGGTAPRWGTPDAISDPCPNPSGATADSCVVSGRLSRLQASGTSMTGSEQVLIEDWCQQSHSHSIGSLAFGRDGALYVSGGDGANPDALDYGQDGNPPNPCGDPPAGVGGTQTPPTTEGGALRSQDRRTTSDPTGLNGTILRVDPATGAALSNNPRYNSNADPNARRIIADGQRNPFRIAVRPGTDEIWVGDVGWNDWEEINRISNPRDSLVENFGWPCYEGTERQSRYDSIDLNICENLYRTANSVTAPYYTYNHNASVVSGETCPTGSSSISGLAFYSAGPYPDEYDGALFFADFPRNCIWVMHKGPNGTPDPSTLTTFVAGAATPVDLQIGPGGDLFYVDIFGGTVRRIEYSSANQRPTAIATVTPAYGPTPLTVSFDGTGSSDPDSGDTLTYAWDLDGDGAYDDSTEPKPTHTYNTAGNYNVGLKVTDTQGASDTLDKPLEISPGNSSPPTATIDTPPDTTKWKGGDTITFSGSATDQEDGTLPASALLWSVKLHHCTSLSDSSSCHEHPVVDFPGDASGSFTAPDHDPPSYLEVSLIAKDSGGLYADESVRLEREVTAPLQPTGGPAMPGPAVVLPAAAALLLGSGILAYAVLRRR